MNNTFIQSVGPEQRLFCPLCSHRTVAREREELILYNGRFALVFHHRLTSYPWRIHPVTIAGERITYRQRAARIYMTRSRALRFLLRN